MKPEFLFFVDIDGVLTPCRKLFHCIPSLRMDRPDCRWYKEYSDRDAWVMLRMMDELVFITQDVRNHEYIKYKNNKFVYASHDVGDKWQVLKIDWKKRVEDGEVAGDPEAPHYIYIGDSQFDYQCLKNSQIGFIPRDASPMLKRKVQHSQHIFELDSLGGGGCIEEAVLWMYDQGWRSSFKAPVFEEIERYFRP